MEMKMSQTSLAGLDLDQNSLALLFGEFDHRIRNIFAVIEAAVRQTQSASVEDYRAKLTGRISGLRHHYEPGAGLDAGRLGLTQLIEQAARPYAATGALILAGGPDLQLEPGPALALHLVFQELATNAHKYGALSSASGCVKIDWRIRYNRSGVRTLAITWSEHGGPEVKPCSHRGFGMRLMERVLEGYGGIRVRFNPAGLVCFILIELDRAATKRPHSLHAA
jgi:two-component sensor histidine kinase